MAELTSPFWLLLWLPAAFFLVLVWRSGTGGVHTPRAWLTLALRLAGSALVVLALAGLEVRQQVDRQAVVFVADLSASVASARGNESAYISQALASRGPDDEYAVVDTGQQAQVDRVPGTNPSFSGFQASPDPNGTNLAAGLRLAGGLLPADYRGRVVLLSGGLETTGDAVAEARALQARGIETDVVPVQAGAGPDVLVDHVDVPSVAHQGERFDVGVSVVSTVATTATVALTVDGTPAGVQQVNLPVGATSVTFGVQSTAAGAHEVAASVQSADDTVPQNNSARAVVNVEGPPSVLVIEQQPGEGANLANALTASGFIVDVRAPGDMPATLNGLSTYGAVVLADVSAEAFSDQQMQSLKTFVHDLGHGLLAVGGDNAYGQGGYAGTPLDDLLPVSSTVRAHRDQGRVAMVLAVDRSGSMQDDPLQEGVSKIEMAKQAARLTVQQLAPKDEIGLLAFDYDPHWVVPLASIQSAGLDTVQQQIDSLVADGGTNIFAALDAANTAISRVTDAQYKHVILMTDGESCCPADYDTLLNKMAQANITVSTIAIGSDADQGLLQHIAKLGQGRYYFADSSRNIPQLMTREARLATRGPLVEGNIQPRVDSADPLITGAASGGLPPLSGYLVTTPKDLAEILLASAEDDPILARWQYGLGRAVAWTSDLNGEWSAGWVNWSEVQPLFAGLVSWTIPPQQGPLQVSVRSEPGTATVNVQESQLGDQPGQMSATIYGPDGSNQTVPLSATAPGSFQGTFPTTNQGTFLVHVQDQQGSQVVASGDAALAVSYSPEYRRTAADAPHLREIARAGGGQVLDQPSAAFAAGLPPAYAVTPLTRPLLLLAAVLLTLEIAMRRLRILGLERLDRLPSRAPARAAAAITALPHARRTRRPRMLPQAVGAWARLPAWAPFRARTRPAVTRGASVVAHASPPRPNLTPPPPPPSFPTQPTAIERAQEESPYLVTLRWLEAKRKAQEQQERSE